MAGIKDAVREVAKSQQTDDIIIKTDRNTQVRVSCIRDDTVFRNLSFCQGKRWRYVDRGLKFLEYVRSTIWSWSKGR